MEDTQRGFRWLVLGLLFINVCSSFMAIHSFPPLFSEILKEIPLSNKQLGLVMGIIPLAALIFAPLGGGVSDKAGCRSVFAAAAILIVVAGALRYSVTTAAQLTLTMFFIGGGIAIFTTVMPKALSVWFPRQDLAKANGIGMSSLELGSALGMATAADVFAPACGGWRGMTVALAAISLATGICWLIFYRDRRVGAGTAFKQENMAENFKTVIKVREVWLLAFVYALFMVDLMAIIAFLPITLEMRGISHAGPLVAIRMIAAVIFSVAGGFLSDRFGRRKIFLILAAFLFALCLPVFVVATGPLLWTALIVSGAVLGAGVPMVMTITAELKQIGPARAGTALGIVLMLGNAGGFAGPVMAGTIMDLSGSPLPAFLFMAAIIIVAGLLVFPLPETGQKKRA